ncbi:MAG: hypothetical protein WEE20_03575 [Bacteroidota bacterium]
MLTMKTVLLISFLLLCGSVTASAQVYLTRDEALKQHFPDASTIERKTVFLTDRQVETIQERAKAKVESKVLTYYVGMSGSKPLGYAFLETHIVRTMPETFMVVVKPGGSVAAVEILAFYEPEDYLPPSRWLGLFRDKTIKSDLWLKRGVQNIVGATLSAQAITGGVRKMLAVYETVVSKEQ